MLIVPMEAALGEKLRIGFERKNQMHGTRFDLPRSPLKAKLDCENS
jgi:hypothetical protein